MSTDPEPGSQAAPDPTPDTAKPPVDASHATNVQIGDKNTQIVYNYSPGTWTEGAVPRPLVDAHGEVVESPYRGLAAFEERHAAVFFGRELAANEVLKRLSQRVQRPGLLVVSGVSGAGKSSLLRAGVLPLIRGGGLASAPGSASWPCLVFTPGRTPLDKLAVQVASVAGADAASVRQSLDQDPAQFALTAAQAALAHPGGSATDPDLSASQQRRLLLIVDQCEQLFTQCSDEGQRRAFITALHAAATSGHGNDQAPAALVVLVVRADFEARCADYPQLETAIQQRFLVTSMTPRQLRMAISEPAKKAGSRVEDDLLNLLLSEVQTQASASASADSHPERVISGAGVLPLLSHALAEAWRHRTGEHLTVSDYERTGGIEGAVADSAQRAYDRLSPAQQSAARQVFTRLATVSVDGVDTADRASRSELIHGKSEAEERDVDAVLESFAAERLLTLGDDTVEISHEVLLTAWPLLRDWLVDTHSDRIVHTRLRVAVTEWNDNNRDRSYLYTGSLLETANSAVARITEDPARHVPLSPLEQEFLRASQRAEQRRVRSRRSFIAVLAVSVIILATSTFLVQQAGQNAVRQRDLAVSGQLTSEGENQNTDPVASRIESLAAWGINPSPEARYAMLTAAARPEIGTLKNDNTTPVSSIAFNPDGKTLATGTSTSTGSGVIQLWDVATRQQIATLNTNAGPVGSVTFSPDGKTLAAGTDGGTGGGVTQLWDITARKQIGNFNNADGVSSMAFTPDGKILAIGTNKNGTQLWDAASQKQITTLDNRGGGDLVAFSPDGKVLVTATSTINDIGTGFFGRLGTINDTRLWDVATHQQITTINTGSVGAVAFSPDGNTLATGTDSGPGSGVTQLWDVATHRQITTLNTNGGRVGSVAFSPDGEALAIGTHAGGAQLWDVASQKQITILNSAGGADLVAFSPDGKKLAVATSTITNIGGDSFTNRGTGNSGTQLWDIATKKQITSLNTNGIVHSVAFSFDGRMLATDTDGNINIDSSIVQSWDIDTKDQIATLDIDANTGSANYSAAFSPDGKTLAIGIDIGANTGGARLLLWDIATRKQIATLNTRGGVGSVAFSSDGKTLASTDTLDGGVQLWDVATRQQVDTLTSTGSVNYSVAFSPDGKTLATGTDTGGVQLWDVATRQQIVALNTNTGRVGSVAFSPDGKTLATGTGTGTDTGGVQLWDIHYLIDFFPELCTQIGGSLPPDVWVRYVPPGTGYRNVCP